MLQHQKPYHPISLQTNCQVDYMLRAVWMVCRNSTNYSEERAYHSRCLWSMVLSFARHSNLNGPFLQGCHIPVEEHSSTWVLKSQLIQTIMGHFLAFQNKTLVPSLIQIANSGNIFETKAICDRRKFIIEDHNVFILKYMRMWESLAIKSAWPEFDPHSPHHLEGQTQLP